MKTLKEVIEAVKQNIQAQLTALEAMPAGLPAEIGGKLQGLKDSLNKQLGALPPLDQVPAALESAGSLNCLTRVLEEMYEYAGNVMKRLTDLSQALGTTQTAHNALQAQITNKEFIAKAEVTELCKTATENGRKEMLPLVQAMRKTVVTAAELPEAPDNILALGATEFDSAIAQAKDNKAKLAELGVKPETAIGKRILWLGKDAFATEHASLTELVGSRGGGPDPLLGNGGGGGGGGQTTERPLYRPGMA